MDGKIAAGTLLNVLSLEDSVRDFEIIREQLIDAGYHLKIDRVEKEGEFTSALQDGRYDIILADFKLPGFDAFGALRLRNAIRPNVPFICVSGSIGEEIAIDLVRLGTVDYVLKDRLARLPFAVKRALDEAQEKEKRKQTEESLRESEDLFRNLFRHHAAIKLLIDPDTGCILDANHAAVEYYGWPYEKITRMKIQDINTLPPDIIKKEMEKARITERIHFEFQHRRADGSVRNVEVFSSGIKIKDKVILHSIVHDITERKRLEAQREKALEEIQTLNNELEQKVTERTVELQKTIKELEELNHVFVGRELKMIELKKRIAELEKK